MLVPALAASAEDESIVFRPLLGVSVSGSDSGQGLGAQVGMRLSSALLRGTLDFGGNGSRGCASLSVRGDWLHPLRESTALVAGIGIASLGYGFSDRAGQAAVPPHAMVTLLLSL